MNQPSKSAVDNLCNHDEPIFRSGKSSGCGENGGGGGGGAGGFISP